MDLKKDKTILVVEDDLGLLGMLRRFLDTLGYHVLEAASGQEAWTLIQDRSPDMVLLDLTLPGIGGSEICRKMRKEASTRATPVFVLSGYSDMETEVQALQDGADDFLAKPFNLKELGARLKALLWKCED